MRLLFRATLALFCLGFLVSTSEAFWRHKDGKRAAGADCDAPSCAAPVTYVPETRNVCVTQYKLVPETVVKQVQVMVPVRIAPPAAVPMAPAGCHGAPAAPAGCHGAPGAPGGCHGAPGLGCHGAPGANMYHIGPGPNGLAPGFDGGFGSRLAVLETKLSTLETKITALTLALSDLQPGAKAQDKTAIPIPPLPVPATPTGNAKPTVGSAATPDADPLLAAARAFKAKQALAKDATPPPAGDPVVTNK